MWVMTSKRFRGTTVDPPYVEFRIGAVKIAEIVMNKRATRWQFFLRLMYNHVAYDIPKEQFESFGDALRHLHYLLNSPAPEGFETGVSK